MAIAPGQLVNFVYVKGRALPSTTDDGTVYFLEGSQEIYVGKQLVGNVITGTGAGFHNSVYRGKNLGTSVSSTQYTAISSGTFDDLFIGDYWVINSVTWRIAAFDYYLNSGDIACTKHHVTIVPDTCLYTAQYHNTDSGQYEAGAANTTVGGYTGSDMYTKNLQKAKDLINTAFGAAHILNHRQLLVNAVVDGHPSTGAWVDSTVELMTEQNVYGNKCFGPIANGTTVYYNYTVDKSQYPLFALEPSRIVANRLWYWLRDVVSAAYFAVVNLNGNSSSHYASNPSGVRPAFSLIG